jgi:hypothetical protein
MLRRTDRSGCMNQIRRLPAACAPRPWRGQAADAHRARLDAQIPGDRQGRSDARGAPGLSRRRIVRRVPGRQFQHDPGHVGRRQRGRAGLFHLRSSASRRRRFKDFRSRPLCERKTPLTALLTDASSTLHYSDHQIEHAHAFQVASSTCRKWQRTKAAHNEALRSHQGTAPTERAGEDKAVTLFTLKRRLTVVTESGSKKKWPA